MHSNQRREAILQLLLENDQPISATAIARQFGVSRQIIVGDIALLRAAGEDICATPRGYLLSQHRAEGVRQTIAACHDNDQQMAQELYLIVDNGCSVLDVTVDHPVYGQLSGQLHISSRYDADQFLQTLRRHEAEPLSRLTGGVHLHTILGRDAQSVERVLAALRQAGILYEK